MYIAMNRFQVKIGNEETFETIWKTRDTHLNTVPGFVEFQLLRSPTHKEERYTLFASHTVWSSYKTFEAWTKSEAFRLAHKDAGENKPLYIGHPNFEGFNVIQTVK